MTYAKKTLSEIKLIHGNYGNFIKGQKLDKKKEKKYKMPPYQDLAASTEIEGETLDEKCWPGYEKKGMKTMFGKRYPNCVKKKKTRKEDFSDWRSELDQVDEGIGSALKAFSKLPAKQRLPLGFAGLFAAGATSRAIQKVKKYMDDKNIDLQVDKYVAARQIPGGPKKIDASPYNAPHHDDYMKSEKPKYKPIQYYDEFGNPRKKTRDELGLRGVNAEKRVPREKYRIKTRSEATMTPAQKRKDTLLKKKYEKSDDMMKSFKDQYGKEKGKNVFYAFIRKKSMEEENIQEILDKKDVPHVKKLVGKLRSGSKTHAKQADDLEKAMKENTAIESELIIQDWNSDDIKFTEIETVDIIKAKPLKENVDLEEGVKRKIIKKLVNKAIKKLGKGGKESKYSVDKALSKKVQLQSIKNQAKYPSELGRQINKGTTPVKVNVSKPINFDKYFGGSPSPVKKKFGSQKPTGTFIDDLPPPEAKPLSKSQKKLMKKLDKQQMKDIENDPMSKVIKKQIEKETGTKTRKFSQKGGVTKGNENEILSNVKPKPKKPLKDHFDWRNELDEDWQKVNRKDKTDGLSKAAVKAYRRENPGSKLQTAVTKDPKKLKKGSKSAKRRLSFCRRMKGMKKKLTSAKTRRDPDSRINKALRRWNC